MSYSKPVAKLLRIVSAAAKRPRWDMEAHARWQKNVSGGAMSRSDAALGASRAGRTFGGKHK
jgi:hypothetical protein